MYIYILFFVFLFFICMYVCMYNIIYKAMYHFYRSTGPDGAVAKSSANWLVGTGFASWYRFQPRAGF